MQQIIKRNRKTVQLTSLLDLLFVMIFLSLLQTKTPPPQPKAVEKAKVEPVQSKPVEPIEREVTATFHFYATKSNPDVPSGKYIMGGFFNRETRNLNLNGLRWIQQPPGYDMVPLNGNVGDSYKVITGRVEQANCKEFKLNKESQGAGLAGVWKGVYSCGQGESGLTLTIK